MFAIPACAHKEILSRYRVVGVPGVRETDAFPGSVMELCRDRAGAVSEEESPSIIEWNSCAEALAKASESKEDRRDEWCHEP